MAFSPDFDKHSSDRNFLYIHTVRQLNKRIPSRYSDTYIVTRFASRVFDLHDYRSFRLRAETEWQARGEIGRVGRKGLLGTARVTYGPRFHPSGQQLS